MHVLTRRIGVALGGLAAMAALAVPMAGQARAADPVVQIVQNSPEGQRAMMSFKPPINTDIKVVAPLRSSTDLRQRWIKHDVGNGVARYESVAFPGKCMQVKSTTSGDLVTVAACNGGAKQLWTQGFSTASFRMFQNIGSSKAATRERNIDVLQRGFTGQSRQLWSVKLF
jgi:hypothetical protein